MKERTYRGLRFRKEEEDSIMKRLRALFNEEIAEEKKKAQMAAR
jgi:hypothetical protein